MEFGKEEIGKHIPKNRFSLCEEREGSGGEQKARLKHVYSFDKKEEV